MVSYYNQYCVYLPFLLTTEKSLRFIEKVKLLISSDDTSSAAVRTAFRSQSTLSRWSTDFRWDLNLESRLAIALFSHVWQNPSLNTH